MQEIQVGDDNINQEPEIIYEDESSVEVQSENEPAHQEEAHSIDNYQEEQVQEKPEKEKKHRIPAKTRINQITRRAYEAESRAQTAEQLLQKLQEENERLKKYNETSNKAVLSSSERALDSDINLARKMKLQAIENGDIQQQIDADEMLAAAVAEKKQLELNKYQQKIYEEEAALRAQQQKPYQSQNQYEKQSSPEWNPYEDDWVNNNPWFSEESDDFDPILQERAIKYAQFLAKKYQQDGKDSDIMGPEYFDTLSKYMNKFVAATPMRESPKQQNYGQGGLVMNRPRTTVGGVSGGSVPTQGGREVVRMTREEQEMARAHGWTDQQWIQFKKAADQKEKAGLLRTHMR